MNTIFILSIERKKNYFRRTSLLNEILDHETSLLQSVVLNDDKKINKLNHCIQLKEWKDR